MRRLLCLVTCLISISALFGSSPAWAVGEISGRVTDKVGRGIPGVTVSDSRSNATETDDDGYYTIDQPVLTSSVRVTASAPHVDSASIDVSAFTALQPVNFELFYSISGTLSRTHNSTVSGARSETLSINAYPPSPGTTGQAGSSCVVVTDSRTAATTNAGSAQQDPNTGSWTWSWTLELAQNSTEGSYNLSYQARDCALNVPLTDPSSSNATRPYTVDNTAPKVTGLSPFVGQNTVFKNQPLQAKVQDQGPSGVAAVGHSFSLSDTSGPKSTYTGRFDAAAGVVTSLTSAVLANDHDYYLNVSVVDNAGNTTNGEEPGSKDAEKASSALFRKISVTPEVATSRIPSPTACHSNGDVLNPIATCQNVVISLGNSDVSVSSSRHSFVEAFVLHTVALNKATLRWPALNESINAYDRRSPMDDEWDPRIIEYAYNVQSRDQLPTQILSTPVNSSITITSLKIALPVAWAAAGGLELSMDSPTNPFGGTSSVVNAGICSTPLSAEEPCTTDPLWSRFSVILQEEVANREAVIDEHRALGVKTLYVYDTDHLRSYEGIISPRTKSAIVEDSRVETVIPLRSPNAEDRYQALLDLPATPPSLKESYIAWAHSATGVTQQLAIDPGVTSSVISEASFTEGSDPPPSEGPAGPKVDSVGLRPLFALQADIDQSALERRRVRYSSSDGSHWVESQPLADVGMRFLVRLNSSAAPSTYSFALSLPSNTTVSTTAEDGAIVLRTPQSTSDSPVGIFHAPTAFDAQGRKIPIKQIFTPDAIRLELDLSSRDIEFPVYADPTYEVIKCSSVHTSGSTSRFLRDFKHCPYGMTFVWARNFWPKRAKVHDDASATYRNVRESGQCSSAAPDTAGWFDFSVPCRMHDYGYDLIRVRHPFAYGGVTKADVDSEFRDAMLEHCSKRSYLSAPFCTHSAIYYYSAVAAAWFMPTDGKEHPKSGWPDYTNFIENEYFYWGTSAWNLRAAPGGSASWATYNDPYSYVNMLEFNCNNSVSGCSVYQDIQANLSGSFKGGELIEAKGQLRCNASSGQCNYRFALWGRKKGAPLNQWDLFGVDSWYVPTGLAPWWDTTNHVYRIPLNTEYEALRWEIYNDDARKNLDIRVPTVRLLDQWY